MAISKNNIHKIIEFYYESSVSEEHNCNVRCDYDNKEICMLNIAFPNGGGSIDMPVEFIVDIYKFLLEEKIIQNDNIFQLPSIDNAYRVIGDGLQPTKITRTIKTDTIDKTVKVNNSNIYSKKKQDENVPVNKPLESLSGLGQFGEIIDKYPKNITQNDGNTLVDKKLVDQNDIENASSYKDQVQQNIIGETNTQIGIEQTIKTLKSKRGRPRKNHVADDTVEIMQVES